MPRFFLYVFIILVTYCHTSYSQTRPVPKKNVKPPVKKHPRSTNLGIGMGLARSVVYLARNVKPNNDATGLNVSLVYGGSKLMRIGVEYTQYRKIDIAPTWYGITANTIEVNAHVLARFRSKKAYFYPLFGLSYNTFSGTYTGINDFLNLGALYQKDERVVTRWLGVNVGTGYEFYFKPGSFFLDYKMRVGLTRGYNKINIQDVCISAGFRFNLRAPSFYSIFVYRGTRSRYLLDKSDED